MANYYASAYKSTTDEQLNVVALTSASTIYGTNVLWHVTTVASAYTLTVGAYSRQQYSDHAISDKPCVKIKCSANCSVQNLTVAYTDSSGAAQTYVFNTDCSSVPKYLVLSVVSTGTAVNGYEL